ncbi:hypothetical protein LTR62_007384 [Meristemomyces frigidus]|uniref:Carboxymuconolactone decarboxylase-like domain-containing protein n=1 Tax=Meristemomyces frigidus TaxID=1508187 RepID=A0AAN7TME6_9PEZI|nr:hypothetical protein LTR62_007384 [Meristemomyces frigidus]
MALTNPAPEEAIRSFRDIETHFPATTLGQGRWYILALSTITAGGHPGFAKDLYLYLISKPEYQSPSERQALMRRLREALVKLVSVVGVPKPLEAIFSMGEVERDEDKDYSFSREHWKSGPENQQRGREWLAQIYRHNDTQTQEMMAAHKDLRWLSVEITYGLYLSDHSILDGIDTELVVLAGIMMQNLARETGWHLRGMRRIGVSLDDVEAVQQCVSKA